MDRLFIIDWKVKAVRNVSPFSSEKDEDQQDQENRQVPDREMPVRALKGASARRLGNAHASLA
jgi:hypothetical protein